MRAVMVMYDTLCRNFLAPYGNDWVKTPNFTRLAEHSVTFERNYVCSLPCMPARRDLHNSRVNFLQRNWGPLEPFDDSMPQELGKHGIYTCLISDHYHYWEDGGGTYHTRYHSYLSHRGQEGDLWWADQSMVDLVTHPDANQNVNFYRLQDAVNRRHITCEAEMPQARTFADALRFLEENHQADRWFLQVESFDPHEPFFTQPEWRELYPELAAYSGAETDWPGYGPVKPEESSDDIRHVRQLYAALVSMCDYYLGKILDAFDRLDLWKDTMLIVNTDHGFLLGEHDWWGKNIMPAYEEISHTPLFLYDPVSGLQGERRTQLTSAIDLPVTLLDFFGVPIPEDMQGHSLLPVIRENKGNRKAALFGFHAGHTAITDGQYTYFRAPLASQEGNCFEYTLMPTRMRERFGVEELRQAVFAGPLPNTKGCHVLKTPVRLSGISPVNFGTKLFDLIADPRQVSPIDDPVLEAQMASLLVAELEHAGAPAEQFERLGLKKEGETTPEEILALRRSEEESQTPAVLSSVPWTQAARNLWRAWAKLSPPEMLDYAAQMIRDNRADHTDEPLSADEILHAAGKVVPSERRQEILYILCTAARVD